MLTVDDSGGIALTWGAELETVTVCLMLVLYLKKISLLYISVKEKTSHSQHGPFYLHKVKTVLFSEVNRGVSSVHSQLNTIVM